MTAKAVSPPSIGWPLLPAPDENGEIHFVGVEESVRRSIEIILRTRRGEQLMRPEFGAGLEDFLNQPNNLTTRRRIRELVMSSLERWEKRIELERVEVWDLPEAPASLRVEIGYRLRRTGSSERMALTMQLEG